MNLVRNKKYWLFLAATVVVVLLLGSKLNDARKDRKHAFDRPEEYFEYFKLITTPIGKEESGYSPNYAYHELKAAKRYRRTAKAATADLNWIQRGPGNVGGRTRTVIIDTFADPTNKTWYAGSVSGGVWKTTDEGKTWECLTDDNLPNLSTGALAMSRSNPQVIYAGTGEGYGGVAMVAGNGIYVTKDKGNSWALIESTDGNENFRYVNKLWIDPYKDSVFIAATNAGMYKTYDAGLTWDTVYASGHAVQDLVENPGNPNVLYASANRLGVLKSSDRGNTWEASYEGMGNGARISLAVSPVDTSYVFASVEISTSTMHVYLSTNAGSTWQRHKDSDGSFINFQGSQGWFNNVILAHPFEKEKVFVGGVYVGLLEFKRNTSLSDPTIVRVDTLGTGNFMEFISFGGRYFSGAMSTGLDEDAEVDEEDFFSVEIRFGSGISQKAHRFTVPEGEGAGVPPEDYNYEDYVDVPFEVWDVDNNRQLMCSFRDQERDGEFNLIEREWDEEIDGREYIFVNAVDYDPTTPDPDIAIDGGQYQKMLYFFWPTLAEDAEWKPDQLPESKIDVQYGSVVLQDMITTVLADDRKNEDLHVDHHDMKVIITNAEEEEFTIVDANDGGLGISRDGGNTWEQLKDNYITTQFYGIAKKPGEHEYIGGMQDNGTWQSPIGQDATNTSEFEFRLGGDGFEALWHPWYPHRILASSYSNYIQISNDDGENWSWADNGINGDGPFITRLSHSVKNPNLVFAVGSRGVYRHTNFGMGRFDWELIRLGDNWSLNDVVTNAHNVKVSLADSSVVWAGAGMYKEPDLNLYVSTNFGETFDTVTNYTGDTLGYTSGLATHPTNPASAFVLFSLDGKPKILRTIDYGQSWEDITQFENDTSRNGFPDVIVNCLLVMPFDTNTIWAGTEIGIFESVDNGESWHLLEGGFPSVSVWQMSIQDDNVIVATHGRGIWSANLDKVSPAPEISRKEINIKFSPNPATEYSKLILEGEESGSVQVKIYSIFGHLMQTFAFEKTSKVLQEKINTSNLQTGTYLVEVRLDGKVSAQKLVVR